jgi:predicted ArsR family transcriptional regulator
MALNEIQRSILETIETLIGPKRNRFVADHEIAKRVGLTVQQVKDYLSLLEDKDYVSLSKDFDGYAAQTAPRGRLALQDPNSLRTESWGTTIVLSGEFQNAILNIVSALTNVSQTINALTDSDPTVIREIEQLVEQLKEVLQQVPPEKAQEAEAVAQAAESFVEAATKETPNEFTVEITKDGLQKAAQNIALVMPTVLTIATQIIAAISKLRGSN